MKGIIIKGGLIKASIILLSSPLLAISTPSFSDIIHSSGITIKVPINITDTFTKVEPTNRLIKQHNSHTIGTCKIGKDRSFISLEIASDPAIQDQGRVHLAQEEPELRGIGGVTTGHTPAITSDPSEVRERFDNVVFDSNSYTIKKSSYRQLDEIGTALRIVMRDYPSTNFAIEVHTSETGDGNYNKSLAYQRAEAVKSYIVTQFRLDNNRIKAIGLHGLEFDSNNQHIEIIRR